MTLTKPKRTQVVFLDSDMIVLQPLDHLFALATETKFAAVPDAFHPCYLNTGVLHRQGSRVLKPKP